MTAGSTHPWRDTLRSGLLEAGVDPADNSGLLAPATCWSVWPEGWQDSARVLAEQGFRWCDLWAEESGGRLVAYALFEAHDALFVLRSQLERGTPRLSSITESFPMAGRTERAITDLFGIAFTGAPDSRRWLRHRAWDSAEHPLRKSFPREGNSTDNTPADFDYPVEGIRGMGVCEIPVGPVHAGIIEPGHFRFHVSGEDILLMEERLGYVHKGIEKIAEGRDAAGLLRLAGRISGDSTVAHAWAAAMAVERAAGITPPARAQVLRAILCERERVANHLGDMGAIANDVGFAFAHSQFGRMRELWQRDNHEWFGHRLLMDLITPGGVARDLSDRDADAMARKTPLVKEEADRIRAMLADQPGFRNRLEGTGILPSKVAAEMGARGYVGRASGVDRDLRRDIPSPPYDAMDIHVPVRQEGDVRARYLIRAEEIQISLDLIHHLLTILPSGPVSAEWTTPEAGSTGLGAVEGWRGEVFAYVRFGSDGRVDRFHPRDPSWLTWPTLERMMVDTIVPDFPVCNKSVNGSYSGHDL